MAYACALRCPYGARGDGAAKVRVSTLVRTFAVLYAFDAARKQRARGLASQVASQSFRKIVAAELSGGGTEVFSGRIGRVFAMPAAG